MRWGPKLRSRLARILPELMTSDFTCELLSTMEECEGAVPPIQNVSGETALSAMKVGMVLNRRRDSELASHLVMNAERLKNWHDFKTEMINITCARAAAARAYNLVGKGSSNSGIQLMDANAMAKGTAKGRGSVS